MLAKTLCACIVGIDAHIVTVEVDIAGKGLPFFSLVGLPDAAVKESRDRVRAALKNIGFRFPLKQVTVNMAPANLRKEGSAFDLPVAIGVAAAEGVLEPGALAGFLLAGELSLDGGLKPVRGALSMALKAREVGYRGIVLPMENAAEAAVVAGIPVYGMRSLPEVIDFFRNGDSRNAFAVDVCSQMAAGEVYEEDFREVKGQEHAKRAFEVAAAGGHNILMIGPPGAGKSMMASRFAGILPTMNFAEAIETTQVYSVAGLLRPGQALSSVRPFRAPHHTISDIALIGGGQVPRPGEVSLAHNGVLFLDELPEFKRGALEVLRQPMESGEVTVSRAAGTVTYPAAFMLLAAMNPCPCGYAGDDRHQCTCSAGQIYRYRRRISGPLMDRIDLYIEVPAVSFKDLTGEDSGERSADIRNRVMETRAFQAKRFEDDRRVYSNGMMKPRHIKKYCVLEEDAQKLLEAAMNRFGMSARAYSRILKVARTIADLAAAENISAEHVSEAIQYRTLDRDFY
jgi:magnesium chelatase family protein